MPIKHFALGAMLQVKMSQTVLHREPFACAVIKTNNMVMKHALGYSYRFYAGD